MKSPRRMFDELSQVDRSVVLVALLLAAGFATIAAALLGGDAAPAPALLDLKPSIGP